MRHVFLALLFASFACQSEPKKNLAPASAPVLSPQQLATGTTPAILLALSQSHAAFSQTIGPHAFFIELEQKTNADHAISLKETTKFRLDKTGLVEIIKENDQNDGFSIYLQNEQAFLSSRYGPLRPGSLAFAEESRNNAFHTIRDTLEPISFALQFKPEGETSILGKPGLRFSIVANPDAKAPQTFSPDSQKAWRNSIQVQEASGELVLEPTTGAVLSVQFLAKYTAKREETPLTLETKLTAQLTEADDAVLPASMPVAEPLPQAFRMTPEREALLGRKKPAKLSPDASKKPTSKPATTQKATPTTQKTTPTTQKTTP